MKMEGVVKVGKRMTLRDRSQIDSVELLYNRFRESLSKDQWATIYNHFDGAALIRWLNQSEDEAEPPKSAAAAQIVKK